jgi:TonB family protein
MIVSERRNYQVAVLFSIIFHLSLILIVFPMQLLSIPDGVEEVAVGFYEFIPSEPQVITTALEPEVPIESEKPPLSKPTPRPKPVTPTNLQSKSGESNQNPKLIESPPKGPVSLGDGVGMVLGFGRKPSYPKNAENEGVEGEVLVRVLITKDGEIESIELIEQSGDSRLDNAAFNSLKREWTFKPNTEDYYVDILFTFINYETDYKLIKSATRP